MSQPTEGVLPAELMLLLTTPISDKPFHEMTTQVSDANFGDGSDSHEGKYFNNKKELKRKLVGIALKGNFEFRMRKTGHCG